MKKILFTALLMASTGFYAQVGIGTTTPASSFEVVGQPANAAKSDGITIPRLSGTELGTKTLVYTAPQTGTIVYVTAADPSPSPVKKTTNVTAPGFYYFDGALWQRALQEQVNQFWETKGNTGTVPGTNFIGTTDAQSFVLRTNNLERMRVLDNGNVGIGTTTPNGTLQFANADVPRRIVFWESANNNHQFTGIGLLPSEFNFQLNNAADNFTFRTGTSATSSNELMRIKGNGNVGIGASNPHEKLDIRGVLQSKQGVGYGLAGTRDLLVLGLNKDTSNLNSITSYVWQAEKLADALDIKLHLMSQKAVGAYGLTYDNTSVTRTNEMTFYRGNVGIGITTPVTKLHVNENITNGGYDFILGNTNQITRGNSGESRALVKDINATLVINFANDFGGGVDIINTKNVGGTVYDLKYGLQIGDHNGWYLLNGRSCNLLPLGNPRARCQAKWGNLPNANNANGALQNSATYFGNIDGDTGTVLGAIGGNTDNRWTNNDLPNHTHGGNTNSDGSHIHQMWRSDDDNADTGPGQPWFMASPRGFQNTQAHNGTANGSHAHAFTTNNGNSLGGAEVNTAPRTMDANAFVYLGL